MPSKQPPPSSTHTKTGELKIRHRHGSGQFKKPPPEQSGTAIGGKPLVPAELDQDSGQRYNPNHEEIQE